MAEACRMVADSRTAAEPRTVEACPMVLSKDASSVGLFVGSKAVFDKAGFAVVAQKTPNRPLMRLEL